MVGKKAIIENLTDEVVNAESNAMIDIMTLISTAADINTIVEGVSRVIRGHTLIVTKILRETIEAASEAQE